MQDVHEITPTQNVCLSSLICKYQPTFIDLHCCMINLRKVRMNVFPIWCVFSHSSFAKQTLWFQQPYLYFTSTEHKEQINIS